MPLVSGSGPLACIRHVWSKAGALGGMPLSPKEVTEGNRHGGSRVCIPLLLGHVKESKVSKIEGE